MRKSKPLAVVDIFVFIRFLSFFLRLYKTVVTYMQHVLLQILCEVPYLVGGSVVFPGLSGFGRVNLQIQKGL